jgi:hypothetical protein
LYPTPFSNSHELGRAGAKLSGGAVKKPASAHAVSSASDGGAPPCACACVLTNRAAAWSIVRCRLFGEARSYEQLLRARAVQVVLALSPSHSPSHSPTTCQLRALTWLYSENSFASGVCCPVLGTIGTVLSLSVQLSSE